ncbi:MAG: hypothetical protein IPK71_12385 [Myxococcales bacterium]|nr:hypothetical protein [Myxococcales bacterium]
MSPLRAFVVVTFASVLSAVSRPARAEERTFGVAVHVAEPEGTPVRDDAWIDAQLAEAERLFGPLGVHFRWVVRTIGKPGKGRVDVETREDRDAFADGIEPRLVNVFVVRSLMDVDEPGRVRRGVTWTQRKDRRRYIVLSSIAMPSVLAHELGHFFGNGHTTVVDNLMSYERGGGVVFLSAEQKSRIAEVATRFATTGFLDVLGPPRAFH